MVKLDMIKKQYYVDFVLCLRRVRQAGATRGPAAHSQILSRSRELYENPVKHFFQKKVAPARVIV